MHSACCASYVREFRFRRVEAGMDAGAKSAKTGATRRNFAARLFGCILFELPKTSNVARVAQRIRAADYGSAGRRFESCLAHMNLPREMRGRLSFSESNGGAAVNSVHPIRFVNPPACLCKAAVAEIRSVSLRVNGVVQEKPPCRIKLRIPVKKTVWKHKRRHLSVHWNRY